MQDNEFQKFWKENYAVKSSGYSPGAREFISRKIKILMGEGRKQEQAVAIAHSMARRAGYKVPTQKDMLDTGGRYFLDSMNTKKHDSQVKGLYYDGLNAQQIAEELSLSTSAVQDFLDSWQEIESELESKNIGINDAGSVPHSLLSRQDLAGRKHFSRKGGENASDRSPYYPTNDNTSMRVRGKKDLSMKSVKKYGGHYDTYEGGNGGIVDSNTFPDKRLGAGQKTPPPAPRKSPINKATSKNEKLHNEAGTRAKKYGISFKEGKGNLTKPKDYAHLSDSEFADPVNYKYPIDENHIRAARSYYGQSEHRTQGGYTTSEWKKIGDKIDAAAKKFKIGEYAEKSNNMMDLENFFPETKGAPFHILIEKATLVETGTPDVKPDGQPVGELPQRLLVEGLASTTNVDHDEERMSPEALKAMVESVNDHNVPLMSEHGKGWDDRLGKVYEASLDDRGQMHIKAELDPDMSKAVDLYKALKKGAQLGLSIAGIVKRATLQTVEALGKKVRTFQDVVLKEVSVTKRPSNFDTWLVAKHRELANEPNLYEKYIGTDLYSEYLCENRGMDWRAAIAKSIPEEYWEGDNATMNKTKARVGQEDQGANGYGRSEATTDETVASFPDKISVPKSIKQHPTDAHGSGKLPKEPKQTVSNPTFKPKKKPMKKSYTAKEAQELALKSVQYAMKAMSSSSSSGSSDGSSDDGSETETDKANVYSTGPRQDAPGSETTTSEGEYGPSTVSDPEFRPSKKNVDDYGPDSDDSSDSSDSSDSLDSDDSSDSDSEDSSSSSDSGSSTSKSISELSPEQRRAVASMISQTVQKNLQKSNRSIVGGLKALEDKFNKFLDQPVGRKGIAINKNFGSSEVNEEQEAKNMFQKDLGDEKVDFQSFFKKHLGTK